MYLLISVYIIADIDGAEVVKHKQQEELLDRAGFHGIRCHKLFFCHCILVVRQSY
jgi:hypothetical protein